MSVNVPLISVIVPVYNVSKYLRVCVDSIISQPFADYELILVDDGSLDDCSSICDRYAEADSRVKVIHKQNGGLSSARNAGLYAACGKYVLFIDGDDFIEENSLSALWQTLKDDGETDVVILNAVFYYDDDRTERFENFFNKSALYKKGHSDALSYLTSLSMFTASACLKLIKRDILTSNNIIFEEIIWSEDADFSINLYLHAKTYNFFKNYIV